MSGLMKLETMPDLTGYNMLNPKGPVPNLVGVHFRLVSVYAVAEGPFHTWRAFVRSEHLVLYQTVRVLSVMLPFAGLTDRLGDLCCIGGHRIRFAGGPLQNIKHRSSAARLEPGNLALQT